MAKAAFRIAVLQCDTPVHAVHVQRGSYGQIFEDLLSQSLNLIERRDISFEVTKWDVVNSRNYPDIASGAIDAILITGSSKSVRNMTLGKD